MVPKTFIMLENNPEVMNSLAAELGLSSALAFHDIYSLTDPDLLALVPRPVLALVVTIPMTPSWAREREAFDAPLPTYTGTGPTEPVLWFKQTIHEACGSIAVLHSLLNLPDEYAVHIRPDSELARICIAALPKTMDERARVLEESQPYEDAHQRVARLGQSTVLTSDDPEPGNHFVAFVKGRDGHLYELEGSRKGPIDRGALAEGEDMLSENALNLGLKRVMQLEKDDVGGDLRFSCTVLGPAA